MFSNYAVASETIPASVDGILIGEAPVAFFLYSESAETVCRGGCCCVELCIIYRRRQ